jgi:hypothetical protein
MEKQTSFKPLLKGILIYLLFMLLYGLTKVYDGFPLSIIAATSESNFQHYKSFFFCILIIDLAEFLVYRKHITDTGAFWYGRVFTAIIAPWFIFLFWYIAPALHGKFEPIYLEIIYANVMTILALVCILIMEPGFLRIRYTRGMKIIILALLAASILLYMVFTFSHLPWADVFVEPQWR